MTARHPPLTALAHAALGAVLRPGDRAVDATVGNGHDTLFLARCVTPGGRVAGFDIQQRALDSATARLAADQLTDTVTLHLSGHEQMMAVLPPDWQGTVGAVMFNLGYLPGGDRSLVTRAQTSRAALTQAAGLLRAGGWISLLLYRGHDGAADETAAVNDWLTSLDGGFRVNTHESPGPVLHLIERLAPDQSSRRNR